MTNVVPDNAREPDPLDRGVFDARYLAFLSTLEALRPSLHRYCARMTGSLADGEDVVQEALFHAYQRLETYDATRPLKPWLFRIAHNRCIDVLRSRGVREEAEASVDGTDGAVWPDDPPGPELGRAVEHLVSTLPPLERASVLLKDVLGHSLDEVAEMVGSTVGGVKAALHRGRAKISQLSDAPRSSRTALSSRDAHVIAQYVERFNSKDWDGLRELTRADARVRVADRFTGSLADSGYFSRYAQFTTTWRVVFADVEDEPLLITESQEDGVWVARGLVRLRLDEGRVDEIADYKHCPWTLTAAHHIHRRVSPLSRASY